MTPADRSKNARIVAYGLFQGQSNAEIERRLLEYSPGLSPADVARAIGEGNIGYAAARALNSGAQDVLGNIQGTVEPGGVTGYAALIRFKIGPNDETDWRSATVNLNAGEDVMNSFLGAGNAAEGVMSAEGRYGANYQLQPDTIQFVYSVPVYATG